MAAVVADDQDTDALGSTTAGSGVGSLRMVDKFRVHPNELRALERGVAVIQVDHPVSSLTRVRVVPAPSRESRSGGPLRPDADHRGASPGGTAAVRSGGGKVGHAVAGGRTSQHLVSREEDDDWLAAAPDTED